MNDARPEATRCRWLGGYPIVKTTTAALIVELRSRLAERHATELYFANTNFVLGCRDIADRFGEPEAIVVNDGIGMDLASLLVHGRRFAENLNGTDFTPRFLQADHERIKLYLFGAKASVVAKVARVWAQLPSVEVVGTSDGYEGGRDNEALVARLRQTSPDVLLVALGNPRQERWAIDNRGRHGVPLVICVGALFDFVAGEFSRAPRWVRAAHLEWAYRLMQEPRRLLRRYSIDLIAFFAHCWRTKKEASARSLES